MYEAAEMPAASVVAAVVRPYEPETFLLVGFDAGRCPPAAFGAELRAYFAAVGWPPLADLVAWPPVVDLVAWPPFAVLVAWSPLADLVAWSPIVGFAGRACSGLDVCTGPVAAQDEHDPILSWRVNAFARLCLARRDVSERHNIVWSICDCQAAGSWRGCGKCGAGRSVMETRANTEQIVGAWVAHAMHTYANTRCAHTYVSSVCLTFM